MFDSSKFSTVKLNIFSTITYALIVFIIIVFSDGIISDVLLPLRHSSDHPNQLQTYDQTSQELKIVTSLDVHKGEAKIVRPQNKVIKPEEFDLFVASDASRRFDSRVEEFFGNNHHCRVQIFMTWISPVDSFSEREFFGLESLFKTNPTSCLIILSKTMDSEEGRKILEPLTGRGFRVRAITPDLWGLVKNTSAERWLNDIKNGDKETGAIPLPQNLSNLIRLLALYKYGGVYLDTDFIILKDFSGLRNSIGAQSIDSSGNWTRLNNAVLVFEENHPLVGKFIDEFASTFDGNIWGHNGPYLVSRVVSRVAKMEEFDFDFTVLPPMAFYPVDWTRVTGYFVRANDAVGMRWVEAKIRQLNGSSYGVHLWNSQSSRFKIEQGSIIGRLISYHCVICNREKKNQLHE